MNESTPIPIIIIACIAGLLLILVLIFGSALGIFVSDSSAIRIEMSEIDREYRQQIQSICDGVEYDELALSGEQADWISVLAVYAVYVGADTDQSLDVVTMDDSRAELLRQVFWDMNIIDWSTETYWIEEPNPPEETVPEETDPEETVPGETEPVKPPVEPVDPPFKPIPLTPAGLGTARSSAGRSWPLATEAPPAESTPMIEQMRLIITVTNLTPDDMADDYRFTADQRAQLRELLLPENRSFWDAVISGDVSG